MSTDRDIVVPRDSGIQSGSTTFPARLATLIGDLSVRAFARKAGVSDTFLRQCLAGRTEPTRTKLIAIAEAGGVTVEWLATGAGPREAGGASPGPREDAIDRRLLERVIEVTESVLDEAGHPLDARRKARLISALYEMHEGSDRPPIARETILKLVS